MCPEERDLSYLWDMRQAAREIYEFVQGVSYNLFENNKILRYAVERQLIVIGEAATHVSVEFQDLLTLKSPGARLLGNEMCSPTNMGKSR